MNITLIGMAGAGKSTIGKELAKVLDYKFIDIDEKIEKDTKLKLQQIIDNLGDNKFLEIEEKEILRLGKFDNYIISPGGSVVYSLKAMKFLKKNSIIVFLNTPFENINKRISNPNTRGIVGLKKKELNVIFKERLLLYEKYADIIIRVSEDSDINIIIKDIIQKVFNISNKHL